MRLWKVTEVTFVNYSLPNMFFFVVTIRINVKIHQKQNVAGPKHLMQIRYKNNALSLFFVVSVTSYPQSQSELYHVSWWYYTLVIDLICQIRHCVFGRLSVKPWYYWLWRLVISNWCVLIRLLSQLNSRLLLVKFSFAWSRTVLVTVGYHSVTFVLS